MDSEQQARDLEKYRRHFGSFCHDCLKIKTEEQEIAALDFNDAQKYMADYLIGKMEKKEAIRCIILKARKEGISTLTAAFFFWRASLFNNQNCYVVSYSDEGVSPLFEMYRLFYDAMPAHLRPMKRHDNAKILNFENPNDDARPGLPGRRSSVRVTGSDARFPGSGFTIHYLHISELGKINDPELLMKSLKPAVPRECCIIHESTAFGVGTYFHREWKRAEEKKSGYDALFFPWWKHKKYWLPVTELALSEKEELMQTAYELNVGQLAWRRWCIKDTCDGDEDLFKQEYPGNPGEAFLSTGRGVFMTSMLERYRLTAPTPVQVGDFDILYDKAGKEKASWTERPDGRWKIYHGPDKLREKKFCVGVDVAEGIDITPGKTGRKVDNSSVHVYDEDGRLCATWNGTMEPDILGMMVAAVAAWYNNAYIVVEANTYGMLVLSTIRDTGYDMTQIHHSVRYGEDVEQEMLRMGFYTNRKTKPQLIEDLLAGMRDKQVLTIDPETIDEMATYRRDARGRMNATSGCRDDRVMSAALCWQGVLVMPRMRKIKGEQKPDEFNTLDIDMTPRLLGGLTA